MRLFCIFSGIIVGIVVPCLFLDYYFDNGFLSEFMTEQSISIMGNILAIYIAVASAFIVIVDNIENVKRISCANTLKQLKNSILFMLIIYATHIILNISTPKNLNSPYILYINGAKLFTFSLFLIMLYELTNVFFFARKSLTKSQ